MPFSVTLHRVFRAPSERIYRAFTDPDAIVKWIAPHGFIAKVEHMDARTGGSFKMSFTNFSRGTSHVFGGRYIELRPHEFLHYTDSFEDPNMPGTIYVTVELKAVSTGTDIVIVQDGIPDVIPKEMCYLGWQESLELLKLLVEPDIPDQA